MSYTIFHKYLDKVNTTIFFIIILNLFFDKYAFIAYLAVSRVSKSGRELKKFQLNFLGRKPNYSNTGTFEKRDATVFIIEVSFQPMVTTCCSRH